MAVWKRIVTPGVVLTIGIAGFLAGTAILIVANIREFTPETNGLLGLMLALCGAFLVGYVFNVVSRENLIHGQLAQLRNGLLSAGERNALGLVEVARDASVYDYSNIILEPRNLVVILNHGQTWVSVHKDRLRRRFADLTKETTFILVHPESPTVAILARKASAESSRFISKIRDTIHTIDEIRTPRSKINIYGHYLYNTYSGCIGDNEAVITLYFTSRGSRAVPVLRFVDVGPGCVFRDLVEDVERLKLDCSHLPEMFGVLSAEKIVSISRAG